MKEIFETGSIGKGDIKKMVDNERESFKRIPDSDLAKFERKVQMMDKMVDTIELVLKAKEEAKL